MTTLACNPDDIRRSIELFLEPGGVIELRVPKAGREGVIAGYFDDPEKLLRAVLSVNGKGPGIYFTLNRVRPDLLARSANRLRSRAEITTDDKDILLRRWLLLDFDPKRPAGISSTDAEHNAALASAQYVAAALAQEGWPAPVVADSGNGGHLLFALDLPNEPRSTELVKAVLKSSARRWGTEEIDVDTTVYNAARISKVYGTIAQKGDSTATRPHRLSRILSRPVELLPVSGDLLERLASEGAPAAPPAAPPRPARGPEPLPAFDLQRWLVERGVRIHRGPVSWDGGEKWVLDACPFNPEHRHPDAAIFRQPSGQLGFKCLHNSCEGKTWKDFRDYYEPERATRPPYVERRQRTGSGPAPFAPLPGESDEADEIPVGPADVEAAAEAAIAANDLSLAMRLIPNLAQLRPRDQVVIVAKLRQHFRRIWKEKEFRQALADEVASQKAAAGPPPDDVDEPSSEGPKGPDLLHFPLTDAGNGERLVAMFGDDIRYCVEMKSWLVWDGVRWVIDTFDVMRQKAKQMCRLLFEQAVKNDSTHCRNHARASESYGAVTAALGFASTEAGIRINAAELDPHPLLFNCANGVIDLRDGTLLRHNREFLMTKLCPVNYDPAARADRFVGFVQEIMGANPDAEIDERTARLVGFLQRAFGYALSADVSEKAVFVFYGKQGNNGKTTLLSVFRDLLGKDYSGQIAIETVMATAKQQDATMRADLADLRGVRFVVTSEVERESKLNERTIKYITAGAAPIKSCRKYENPIEFWATHKLFMDCNYRPTIRGSEDAIWKRLKLVPFDVQLDEARMDKQLGEKLRRELPGILGWAVRGCIDWQKNGMGEPPEVKEAGKEWRDHDDPLKEFLDDCCEVDLDNVRAEDPSDRLWVPVRDLNAAYEWWSKGTRERFPLGREGLREKLEGKGFWEYRSRRVGSEKQQVRTWEGLALKSVVSAAVSRRASQVSEPAPFGPVPTEVLA